MIPNEIVKAMDSQDGEVKRLNAEKECINRNISLLGLENHNEIKDFFLIYDLSGVISKAEIELLDLCSPSDEILETTEWARDIYDVDEGFVCLSSGEGEGFILFSKYNGKIYDVSVSELGALEEGKVAPRWNSFYDLLIWYLQ